MPVHAVAAGAGGGEKFRGETPGPNGHPRIAKTGEGFQRLLAIAEQGHAEALLNLFEVEDERLSDENEMTSDSWLSPFSSFEFRTVFDIDPPCFPLFYCIHSNP